MAAYCACCGAEITLKAEACEVCGTPRHGMMPANTVIPSGRNEKLPTPQSDPNRLKRLVRDDN